MNYILISIIARYALCYIVFPFSNALMMYMFHYQMNKKMTYEISSTFEKGNECIQAMFTPHGDGKQFQPFTNIQEYRKHCKYIKKMCDYAI